MNVFNKVTVHTLKKNKTRTLVTIIGIMLSAAMICAVTTFVSSIYNYAIESTSYSEGSWHIKECDTNYEAYKAIADNEEIEQAGYLQQVGYSSLENVKQVTKPYLYVVGTSKDSGDLFPFHVTSGHYPKSSSEIMLPEHLYGEGGIKYNIGDKITLDLGNRMLDGIQLSQNDGCIVDVDEDGVVTCSETLEHTETRTYTVVGFYERTSYKLEDTIAPGYTAVTLADDVPSDKYRYDVYFSVKHPASIVEFAQEEGIDGTTNRYLLMFSGVSDNKGFDDMLYGMATIVILIIMFGTVALIYNAFSISVAERTKQFGLLSSIGATRKQIRNMVLFEALAVSAIGIPLGILVGIGGIGITFWILGEQIASVMGASVEMSLCVTPVAVIVAMAVALITVLISAWIPSKRATKSSVINIIRQQNDIKAKNKKLKTPKYVYKLFGVPGMIADKYYKRNKKRYRATVLSLFMSIVLFVSSASFCDYLMEATVDSANIRSCDLTTSVSSDEFEKVTPEELLDEIKKADSVTDALFIKSVGAEIKINEKYMTEEFAKSVENMDGRMVVRSIYVDDAAFKSLLKENGLSEEKFMNPEKPLAVAVSGIAYDPQTGEEIYKLKDSKDVIDLEIVDKKEISGYYPVGETVDENGNEVVEYKEITGAEENGKSIYFSPEDVYNYTSMNIGKVIYKTPSYLSENGSTYLIYPKSLEKNVYEDKYATYEYRINSDNHTKSYEAIEKILIDHNIANDDLTDLAELEETKRNIVTIVQVFAYGFIVLISLIAVANVFNTITTNIGLRRREFAMLKSIGMTKKNFNKMMNFECLLYGSRALLYGLSVSCIVTYFIYRVAMNGADTVFRLPWGAICIAVLIVFLVVFVTMMYSMRKIKKDNPIDALKNENL